MQQERVHPLWSGAAAVRRAVLLVLLLAPTFFAGGYMASVLPYKGTVWHETLLVIVFTMLFAWISMGFWTALVGFITLRSKFNRFHIPGSKTLTPDAGGSLPISAILIPVCNEYPARVFAGIAAIYKSLEKTGRLDRFEFFVLSDTSDPDVMIEEELAWDRTCRMLKAGGRIFYRRRKLNIKRKSGNVADFCRRWGKNYPYMFVLDADSIMSGATMVRMVEIMNENPDVGILQTAPKGIGRESLIARMQQFANNVYGPIFTVGLSFWQLGDAHFWGHNAILRVEPFMKYCALPSLPGKPPLGGDIMSHDFVEAALMRRGGWAVWLAFDLEGSYEEMPPTLLDELKRDRRWCQGNMQHLRLLFTKGLCPVHRALFVNGAFSYISALLWFFFLTLCTGSALYQALHKPDYFPPEESLFPNWPVVWHPDWSIGLLAFTAVILFLPKGLSILHILFQKGRAKLYGGAFKLVLSVIMEVLFSTLLAPVRMLFHSKFVFITMLGQQVGWGGQQRDDRETSWGEAFRFMTGGTILAFFWGAVIFIINRTFFWWLIPILTGLSLSIPMCVIASKASWGRALRDKGFLLIPEEKEPPQELLWLEAILKKLETPPLSLAVPQAGGFTRAVVEPFVNALHIKIIRDRKVTARISERRGKIAEKALAGGPGSLTRSEKRELLTDPACLAWLHRKVWQLSDTSQAGKWGIV
jgi:membrane glycosyltransferase